MIVVPGFVVMPGLNPGIHQKRMVLKKKMDCRVKPGNDGWGLSKINQPNPVGHERGLVLALDFN
jgi:hypothetical protein